MFETFKTVTGNEPVTVEDLKKFLRVAYDDDDLLIGRVITQAREYCERETNRSFIAQTIELNQIITDNTIEFRLPFPNHTEVTEVKVNGSLVDYSTVGLYRLTVILSSYPVINGYAEVYIKFKSVNGFDENGKIALMNVAKQFYENRGDTEITANGLKMLQPYKIYY